MQRVWGESPFYQAKLRGPAPDRLLFQPDDPYTPDQEAAEAILEGRIAVGDEVLDCEGELDAIWNLPKPKSSAYAFLHEFGWLRHLASLGSRAQPASRIMVRSWLDGFEKWASEAWDPYIVSERLVAICAHHPLILTGSDSLWRSRVLTSMARQTRHLALNAHRADTGLDRLMTALGLCVVGHCLPGCEAAAERGMEMARRELRLQLRADGGHVSRNPSRQLKLAVRLIAVLRAVEARGFQSPGFLRHTVMRACAMAVFFRCGDGRLVVFNGGHEDDARALLAVQQMLEPDVAPTGFARHSGYHKLSGGRAQLVVDTAADEGAHRFKSASAFHFSSGRSRIIGNCGAGTGRASDWRAAMTLRAAHSSLSFEFAETSAQAQPSFADIACRRAEDGQGSLIEVERRLLGADAMDGLTVRRLFLAAGGADLRGEETLSGLTEDLRAAAVWRFHLHPSVKASLARDRKSVLLLLPNKEGWRFKSNAKTLFLEKSVYCGEGGAPVAAEQITLRAGNVLAVDDDKICAKWALRRLDAG